MSLSSKITAGIKAVQSLAGVLASARTELTAAAVLDLTDGIGAGQADRLWSARRTIAASGTDDLDLVGALADAFGAVTTFARVRGLLVKAAAANTNNVIIGGAANGTQFASWLGSATDRVVVRPGGFVLLGAPDAVGYTVTPATGDMLRVANSAGGTPVTYDVVIIGASA